MIRAHFDKLRSRTVIFLHDLLMVPLAWFGAYWLRFNLSEVPEPHLSVAIKWLPLVVVIQGVVFRLFGLYRGIWRFASMPDLLRIAKASASGIILIVAALFFLDRLDAVPRSVIPLYTLLLVLFLSAPRALYRIWKDRSVQLMNGRRALIVGAGKAGETLVRDLLRSNESAFAPVAFVDDDPHKRGWEIHSLRVCGACDRIPPLVEKLDIEAILIAMPSAGDQEMRRIVEICETTGLPFLTLPSVRDMWSGRLSDALRDVSIEDLLGRAPVRLDSTELAGYLDGKCIMVTGGGGSIGSELCKQIAQFSLGSLVVFEHSEFNLYRIELELRQAFPDMEIHAVLGDVTDAASVRRAIDAHKPAVIFHAAAYKHVPLLQQQVREAVFNNVIGTRTVAEAAVERGVGEFVLISTDKAVNPTNVMGATKRAAELVVQSYNGEAATRFITVRFGNVLGSAGSVVPLFREQIRNGGPVTVTHPEVTRFFMTIPEACQLIMKAAATGQGGEVFVLDMGEPIRIGYLAEQMIRLSGKRPGEDIAIEHIGLRPGEKMHEELFLSTEQLQPTGYAKLMLAQATPCDRSLVAARIAAMDAACRSFDQNTVSQELCHLVPEYRDAGIAS
ncbi:polysaccharide biosynthesis protein [Methylococcus mesophilus]|uniref:polysaccharide biosynthesis protein n=1 Tax=Methylococcus mesophilus TaxID=2993564 RepID=UPI00224B7826|nr:nucleoside-diphosphate sugar epimerase/dehydratase [Methylococcus mesophilus]UZR30219.1 nucleoside-diphosphate sugar epimerase/dehydratase [Methylococcus mesophilus]